MKTRTRSWMASAALLCFFLGSASSWAEPVYRAPARKSAPQTPKLQIGKGVYVGTVTKFADRKGRLVRAELRTDRGTILLVSLKGKGLEMARKARGQRVEVIGTAKLFASSTSHGIDLIVDRWQSL